MPYLEKAMLKRIPVIFVLIPLVGALSGWIKDAPPKRSSSNNNHSSNNSNWFRYYNDKHQPTISDTITPEHISHGYDILNAQMQVIKHVDAQHALTPEETAKAKHDLSLSPAKSIP